MVLAGACHLAGGYLAPYLGPSGPAGIRGCGKLLEDAGVFTWADRLAQGWVLSTEPGEHGIQTSML